jgi:hypothetical protein
MSFCFSTILFRLKNVRANLCGFHICVELFRSKRRLAVELTHTMKNDRLRHSKTKPLSTESPKATKTDTSFRSAFFGFLTASRQNASRSASCKTNSSSVPSSSVQKCSDTLFLF